MRETVRERVTSGGMRDDLISSKMVNGPYRSLTHSYYTKHTSLYSDEALFYSLVERV